MDCLRLIHFLGIFFWIFSLPRISDKMSTIFTASSLPFFSYLQKKGILQKHSQTFSRCVGEAVVENTTLYVERVRYLIYLLKMNFFHRELTKITLNFQSLLSTWIWLFSHQFLIVNSTKFHREDFQIQKLSKNWFWIVCMIFEIIQNFGDATSQWAFYQDDIGFSPRSPSEIFSWRKKSPL